MTATNDNKAVRSIVESEVTRDLKVRLGLANALCRIRYDRIRELEAQLEAIGAGGVGPLMQAARPEPDPSSNESAYQRGYLDSMAKGRRSAELDQSETACHRLAAKRLTRDQWEEIAHRTASRYSHRSDPTHIAYTFLPHTLEHFVSQLQYEIDRLNGGDA